MTSTDLRQTASDIVKKAARRISPLTYIASSVRSMEREEVDQLAIAYLMLRLKQNKRAAVAEVEKRTTKPRRGTRAYERWAADPINADAAKADAEFEAEMQELRNRSLRKMQDGLKTMIQDFERSLRDQWTQELLGQTIALGDGTTVTWGEATIEQHEARYAMHMKNAVAGAEGAARHLAAIETIRATKTTNLYEAVGGNAA